VRSLLRLVSVAATLLLGVACAPAQDEDANPEGAESGDNEVKVDTSTPRARAQYDANVNFAAAYRARCTPKTGRKRVLVTGFGRYMSIDNNATGRLVSALVPTAKYPETHAPADGLVDDPAPQLSVATETLQLDGVGAVDVCAMILPVYWDLAGALIAKELDAFAPDLVLMNGVAGSRQPIWIELGAVNRAAPLDDGSSQLRPALDRGASFAPIVQSSKAEDNARSNLLSWDRVRRAAEQTATRSRAVTNSDGVPFAEVLDGAKLAGFPRNSNTYLCNNTTYVAGYLMDHPGKTVRLMRASRRQPGALNALDVTVRRDLRNTPRAFVHWPSSLDGAHVSAAADVLRSMIAAQLSAGSSDAPSRGDNRQADPSLQGGEFF
jgi:pyrrolidone-carboxylate peptidase